MQQGDEFNIPPRELWQLLEGLRNDVMELTVQLTVVRGELEQTRTCMLGVTERLGALESEGTRLAGRAEGRSQVFTAAQAAVVTGLSVASFIIGLVVRLRR